MKRSIVFALAIALFAACSTKEIDFQTPAKDDTIFYASFEQPGDPETKVYANEDLLLRWTADDRVSIFNKNTYNQQYQFIGETGDYEGGFNKIGDPEFITGDPIPDIVSVYPFQRLTRVSENETISVTLPSEQTYAQNSFGLGANTMVSVSSDNLLKYRNVGGYLMLKLYGEGVSVSSITLKGNNGEKLAGTASVSMPLNGLPSVEMESDATTEIILKCATPIRLGATEDESIQFWFVVPPVTFTKGFTITVKDDNHCFFEKSTEKSLEIVRNKMAKMSAFEVIPAPSIKDFAKEFVKGLDIWQATVGTVESDGLHMIAKGTAWENAHFIPIVPNPGCEYLSHEGNQYDSKYTPWVLNVAGQEISSSQAWEIAIRGLMNMVTTEGEAFLPTMDNRNKAYTLGDNQSFSETGMPNPSESNQWGKHPWYETNEEYGGVTYNYEPVTEVDVNFIVKVGAWHVVRSFVKTSGNNNPLGTVGNFQQFGTSNNTLNLDGYEGYICPMRELLILMRIYKYLLDNNIEENVYSAIKDQKFDFDLYGYDIPAAPEPEAVDLGLSVKWASFNLGASAPEEFGNYYAWGETEPKDDYSWSSYWFCMGNGGTMTKYCSNSDFGYDGFTDTKTSLDPEDDAARVILRGKWRMPTDAEWDELINKCAWTWTTQNCVNGYLVTASNGNSIFLPAAGCHPYNSLSDVGLAAYYWSTSLYTDDPEYSGFVSFDSGDVSRGVCIRIYGCSIRSVYEQDIVSFLTNSEAQTWVEDSNDTYGSGYATVYQGLNIAYYKHTSTSTLNGPNASQIRVYKNAVLSIASNEGKKIKKIVIGTAPNYSTNSYCFNMVGLEGGADANCDKDALTITWTGSASKVVLQANNGQIRMEKLTVEFE